MTVHAILAALAAGAFVAVFSALVVTAVIVLFGGRDEAEPLRDEAGQQGTGAVRVLRPDDPRGQKPAPLPQERGWL